MARIIVTHKDKEKRQNAKNVLVSWYPNIFIYKILKHHTVACIQLTS